MLGVLRQGVGLKVSGVGYVYGPRFSKAASAPSPSMLNAQHSTLDATKSDRATLNPACYQRRATLNAQHQAHVLPEQTKKEGKGLGLSGPWGSPSLPPPWTLAPAPEDP